MKDNISIKIPSQSKYISVARLVASLIASHMEFDLEAVDDIKVAVGEACNNVIIHSDNNNEFNVNFIVDKNELLIEIQDFGKGFIVDNYMEPDIDNPQGGGLGLFIIKELMDDMVINSEIGKGTKITMSKKLVV